MAHEVETAMYTRTGAWHSKGNVWTLDRNPTIDEAIDLADCRWRVHLRPLYIEAGGIEVTTGHKCAVRDSDGKQMGVLGPNTQVLQNVDAFSFMQPFVESGEAHIDAAGSLRGGKRVWVLAKLTGQSGAVVESTGDTIEKYLLLMNPHDGSGAVLIMPTTIRVVCMNTARAAVRNGSDKTISISHTKGMGDKLKMAQCAIAAGREGFRIDLERFRCMAETPIDTPAVYDLAKRVLSPDWGQGMKEPRGLQQVMDNWHTGVGVQLTGGHNVWRAYNAMTEYFDHYRGRSDDNRLQSTLLGQSSKDRETLMTESLELVAAG